MKSTGLYYGILKLVGYRSDPKISLQFNLKYTKWWRTIVDNPVVQENWVGIRPNWQKWNNDMLWIYPQDLDTYNITLSLLWLSQAGSDMQLQELEK
jgi:hypothetical protein